MTVRIKSLHKDAGGENIKEEGGYASKVNATAARLRSIKCKYHQGVKKQTFVLRNKMNKDRLGTFPVLQSQG